MKNDLPKFEPVLDCLFSKKMLGSDFVLKENNNKNEKKMTDRGKCLSLPRTGNGFVNKVKFLYTT